MYARLAILALLVLVLLGNGGCSAPDVTRLQQDIHASYLHGADSSVAISGMPYREALELRHGREVIVGLVSDSTDPEALRLIRGYFYAFTDEILDTVRILHRIEGRPLAVAGADSLSLYRGQDRASILANRHYRAIQIDAVQSSDQLKLWQIDMDHVVLIVDVGHPEGNASRNGLGAVFLGILGGAVILLGTFIAIVAAGMSGDTGGGCLALLLGIAGLVGMIYLLAS